MGTSGLRRPLDGLPFESPAAPRSTCGGKYTPEMVEVGDEEVAPDATFRAIDTAQNSWFRLPSWCSCNGENMV
jgi:hypothetical protein